MVPRSGSKITRGMYGRDSPESVTGQKGNTPKCVAKELLQGICRIFIPHHEQLQHVSTHVIKEEEFQGSKSKKSTRGGVASMPHQRSGLDGEMALEGPPMVTVKDKGL